MLLILVLKVLFKDINELTLHQKIPHRFDYIMMAAGRKQHVVHSFLKNGQKYANDEVPNNIHIAHQLKYGVKGQSYANCIYNR